MATSLFLVQLLFIGTLLIIPAYAKDAICNLFPNATAGNFDVVVTPKAYKANTTYLVKISDNTNSNAVSKYFLQALTPQNNSVGKWNTAGNINCSSIDTAVVNVTQKAANWTSPHSDISSVEIRAYAIFTDQSAKFKTVTLNKGEVKDGSSVPPAEEYLISPIVRRQGKDTKVLELARGFSEPGTTTAPPTTTPNSVSMVHSSSFFIAIVQLPLLLVTSKLLS